MIFQVDKVDPVYTNRIPLLVILRISVPYLCVISTTKSICRVTLSLSGHFSTMKPNLLVLGPVNIKISTESRFLPSVQIKSSPPRTSNNRQPALPYAAPCNLTR